MAYKWVDLRSMSEEDLIRAHDETARSGYMLTPDYFLNELARRSAEKSNNRMLACTYAITIMTTVMMILTAIMVFRQP